MNAVPAGKRAEPGATGQADSGAAQIKRRAALTSLTATAGLAGAKLAAAAITGSVALLGAALDGILDLAVTALTFWAVTASERPADADHPYGHGKIESLVALFQVVVLCGTATFVGLQAAAQLLTHEMSMRTDAMGMTVMVVAPLVIVSLAVSVGVDGWRAHALSIAARRTGSAALAADAIHFRTDMWTTLVVLGGVGAAFLGLPEADPIAALVIAATMGWAAFKLGCETLTTLADGVPPDLAERIAAAAAPPPDASIARIRTRPIGARHACEVALRVPPGWTVAEADALCAVIKDRVRHAEGLCDVVVVTSATKHQQEASP
ncbi:MAG: cation diffusion facilitator family transporter [Pseudomonadota bacterium]